MTPTKGVCRTCLRAVPATAGPWSDGVVVTTSPFGNVRLHDHYTYKGGQRKLCEGSGRLGRPARVEEHEEEKSPFGIPEGIQRRYKFKLFEVE